MNHPLHKFDLNLLVAYEALMTERGVTRAGQTLGITQAAMSNTLRRLRELFGDPLFVKSGARMEPTARAMALERPVRQALAHVRKMQDREAFVPAHCQRTFRLGAVDYSVPLLLPDLMKRLARAAPQVKVTVVDIGGADQVELLERGEVDLVFGRFQWSHPGVTLRRSPSMEYVCIHRQGHPLGQGPFTLEKLMSARYIHYYPRGMATTVVDEALAEMGLTRQVVARLSTLNLLPLHVASSDLMAIVPDATARIFQERLPLRQVRLPFATAPLRPALAWHPRSDRDPPNIWFRDQVAEILDQGLAVESRQAPQPETILPPQINEARALSA